MTTATHALSACRSAFPILGRIVDGKTMAFFDGPAGTHVPQAVIDAISNYYSHFNSNCHGEFTISRESDQIVHETRERVATFLNAPSWKEISFGPNMTTLAFNLSRALTRTMKQGDEVVITQLDHEGNRSPWMTLAEAGAVIKEVALRPDGTLDPEDLARKIGPRTRLVAIGYASNALGTVNDLALARRLSKAVGAWLLVDAVHAAPHFVMDVAALDTDFLLCSAYKWYGPHIGILYARPGLLEELPTYRLRTQDPAAPFRIETGTLNHACLAGVGAAVAFLAGYGEGATLRERLVCTMTALEAQERALAKSYYDQVRAIPGVTVWGPDFSAAHRAPTVSITVKGVNSHEVARRLGDRGVAVWDGHFYAARCIEVLGLESQGGVVRSGMSMYTQADEVQRLVDGVAAAAKG
jgi:cysteine desulfurase family protein (TIGR01976 family)